MAAAPPVGGAGPSARSALPKAAPKGTVGKTLPPPRPKQAAPPTVAQQAAKLANQTIAAQVASIQQQQQAAEQAARERAQQINMASLAASHMLSGLGTPTYNSYKDAATTLAGLAGGYSGQLRTDATAEAQKVQQDLASVGSPQTASNNGDALANVLYGMRGAQPASVLLNSGAAAAAAANALPGQVIGYGQNLAAGALGAGRQAADALTPSILDARAKAPSLVAQYISSLTDQAAKAQALANSTAATNSLIASRGNSTALSAAKLKAQQQQFVTTYNLKVAKANQAAAAAAGRTQTAAEIRAQKAAQPNATLSGRLGYLVTADGTKIPGADGKPQVLPGFFLKNGKIVKVSTARATGAASGKTGDKALFPNLSTHQVGILRKDMAGAYYGLPVGAPDPSTGSPLTEAKPRIDYNTAIQGAVMQGYSHAYAVRMANRFYKPGENGRPMNAKQAAGAKAAKAALAPPAWVQ